MESERLTSSAMDDLDAAVCSMLPRTVVLMLRIAEHMDLESLVDIPAKKLMDQTIERDGWVFMGERSPGPTFWLPSDLVEDVTAYWARGRNRRHLDDVFDADMRLKPSCVNRTNDDLGRMFSRGRRNYRRITAAEIFGMIARALRGVQ